MPEIYNKINKLDDILRSYGPALVAFSGGLDSSFLLWRAALINPGKILALTLDSLFMSPADRLDLSLVLENLRAKGIDFQHKVLTFDSLSWPEVSENSPQRCYFCKKKLAAIWKKEALASGLELVFEGGQKDDEKAHRPGKRAILEEGLKSPLAEASFTKEDIRKAGERFGLWGFERPSQACLASRVPFGEHLSAELLNKIYQTEEILIAHGFKGARARSAGSMLRLELLPEQMERVAGGEVDFWQQLPHLLASLGWSFITLDLKGYQNSCFDKV